MAAPIPFDSALTEPGGTGPDITVNLSTHAAGDILAIWLPKTGNASWTVPADWLPLDQRSVGNAGNGVHGSWFARQVLAGDTLPLTNPLCTLGATVTRAAGCVTIRGGSLEGIFVLPSYGARGFSTGTTNPISPPPVTTLAPEMLVIAGYGQRSATDAPDPSGYTQLEEAVGSAGTLVMNLAYKTVADQSTVLSNQDASPTSGARWVAGILCIPSADYPYYRAGSQATTPSGTQVTPVKPTGTTNSDVLGNADVMIATVEGSGSTTLAATDTGLWTEIGGVWSGTTSGGGSSVKKFWAKATAAPNMQFTRTGTGEISACITTYYNCHQTNPIGTFDADARASSTTSTFDAIARSVSKVLVQATCVADDVPTFTSPSGWIERMDGLGITCSDQIYNSTGSSASASFTLSSESPTLVGLTEILGIPPPFTTFERSAAISAIASVEAAGQSFTVLERSATISATGAIGTSGTFFSTLSAVLDVSMVGAVTTTGEFFSILERASDLATTGDIAVVAEFLSILESAASIVATLGITSNGLRLPPPSVPSTPILDDFNRADQGPPPSANWTTGFGFDDVSEPVGHGVVSNTLRRASGAETVAESYWSAEQFGPDSECYITAASLGIATIILGTRMNNPGAGTCDGYFGFIFHNDNISIYKVENSIATELATSVSIPQIITGNKYGIQAIGSTIRLWVDDSTTDGWEVALEANDSTFSGAGFVCLRTESSGASSFDDFGGGTLGLAEIQRTASLDVVASIAVAGEFFSTFERSATFDGAASIAATGTRIVERTVTCSATVSIVSAAQFFSTLERSAVVDGVGSIVAVGARVVDRVASIASTATVDASAESFSIFESALSLNVAGAIESSGAFFSIFDRQSTVNGVAGVTVSGQAEHNRQAVLSVVANISASGDVLPPGAATLERSAALEASGTITTSASLFSVVNRDASLSATGAATVSAMRELQRQAEAGADTTITTAGVFFTVTDRASVLNAVGSINTSGGVFVGNELERAVSFSVAGNITVSGETVSPTVSPIIVIRQSAFASPKITRGEFALIRTRNVTFQ